MAQDTAFADADGWIVGNRDPRERGNNDGKTNSVNTTERSVSCAGFGGIASALWASLDVFLRLS